jgi:23S rRNA pseudouridine1911/1915/1917 synthase
MTAESFTVTESRPAERFDRFLHARFPATSRAELQRLLAEGCIRVNGKVPKASHHPKAGEVVDIAWPEPTPSVVVPQDIPIDILFEDEDFLVLNKSPDVVVHPAHGHADGTLVNALLHHCRGSLSGIGGVERPGIVHRLDLETSGCLVVAKNDACHRALQEQFAARTVEKIYHCIVCGDLNPPLGDMREAIARHPSHRKRMAVTTPGKGRAAWTSYRLLERLRGAAYSEAVLHTGRTHQIRVHFQHLGFPLVGDSTYGVRQNARLESESSYHPPRQMLHARKLGFEHPRTGAWRDYEAPLPPDFVEALMALRV